MTSQRPTDDSNREPIADRRGFFRRLLLRTFTEAEQLGRSISHRYETVEQSLVGDERSVPRSWGGMAEHPPVHLRPPGALPDPEFLDVCSRCGDCAKACPAVCIVLDEGIRDGTPHIVARTAPCVICDDLSCMKVCPTGALTLVPTSAAIRMGTARVDLQRCLRGPAGGDGAGEDCLLCTQQCPVGETALIINEQGDVQVEPGCVGCGVCEAVCPTQPASITVIPMP